MADIIVEIQQPNPVDVVVQPFVFSGAAASATQLDPPIAGLPRTVQGVVENYLARITALEETSTQIKKFTDVDTSSNAEGGILTWSPTLRKFVLIFDTITDGGTY